MTAQLSLPRLSGRLPEQSTARKLAHTAAQLAQPEDITVQDPPLSPLDVNHNHNISSVSAAAQEQRGIRLLASLFKKRTGSFTVNRG